MKKIKYMPNFYGVEDWRKLEQHLEKMAGKGWKLESAGRSFWKYSRIRPQKIHYAVTCLPDLMIDLPRPDPEEEMLTELCEAGGWKRTAEWNGLLIYESLEKDPVPIETDETIRMETIHETVWKRQRLLGIMMLFPVLLVIVFPVPLYIGVQLLNSYQRVALYLFILDCFLIPVGYWTSLDLWRRYAERKIEQGNRCPPNYFKKVTTWITNLLAVTAILFFCAGQYQISGTKGMRSIWYIVVYMTAFYVIRALLNKGTIVLRKRGIKRGINKGITLIIAFLLFFLLEIFLRRMF